VTVSYTRAALADIENLHAHIARQQGAARAFKIASTIKVAIDRLQRFPRLGRAGRVAGTRELVVARVPYVVVYLVQDDAVIVQRVLHASQQWPPDEDDA
jgi:addiction module RelE/StbE family toxin